MAHGLLQHSLTTLQYNIYLGNKHSICMHRCMCLWIQVYLAWGLATSDPSASWLREWSPNLMASKDVKQNEHNISSLEELLSMARSDPNPACLVPERCCTTWWRELERGGGPNSIVAWATTSPFTVWPGQRGSQTSSMGQRDFFVWFLFSLEIINLNTNLLQPCQVPLSSLPFKDIIRLSTSTLRGEEITVSRGDIQTAWDLFSLYASVFSMILLEPFALFMFHWQATHHSIDKIHCRKGLETVFLWSICILFQRISWKYFTDTHTYTHTRTEARLVNSRSFRM